LPITEGERGNGANETIPEPHIERTRLDELPEILFTAVCAILYRAESWKNIADPTILQYLHGAQCWPNLRCVYPNVKLTLKC